MVNIEAKDRKLAPTNFKLGLDTFDHTESAVTVYKFEVTAISSLASLIAPFSKRENHSGWTLIIIIE